MKIKEINYKINPKGKWRSQKIAKEQGEYTYPVLLTIIEDIEGNKIEVPLSYEQIVSMLEKHIWLEKILDWDVFRSGQRSKIIDAVKDSLDKAISTDSEKIREWFEEIKEE